MTGVGGWCGRVTGDSGRKTVNLALQSGGSDGALAWGALDRILEDNLIAIEGILGTSAGAMNAAVTAYGLTLGGNDGARQALATFSQAVAEAGTWSIMQPSPLDRLISPGSLDFSPGSVFMDTLSRVWSPYQMNPANYHPRREILNQQIDFDRLRGSGNSSSAANAATPSCAIISRPSARIHRSRSNSVFCESTAVSPCLPAKCAIGPE